MCSRLLAAGRRRVLALVVSAARAAFYRGIVQPPVVRSFSAIWTSTSCAAAGAEHSFAFVGTDNHVHTATFTRMPTVDGRQFHPVSPVCYYCKAINADYHAMEVIG